MEVGRTDAPREPRLRTVPGPAPAAAEERGDPALGTLEGLGGALVDSVSEAAGGGPVSLLFSGGLDSSLLAHLLIQAGTPFEAVAVGMPGSHDLSAAETAGTLLGIPVVSHELAVGEVERTAVELRACHPSLSRGSLSVQVGLAAALAHARHPRVLCGQGADELFFGYSHFLSLGGAELKIRADSDLERLTGVDLPISRSIAQRYSKDLRAPYLAPSFVRAVRGSGLLSYEPVTRPKGLLRDLAGTMGLPPPLVERPKKALQYGTGISRLLSRRPVPEETHA
jgi:asparagine synthase (glutamine-hydrolysing)